MKSKIRVMLKESILDPQGVAVQHAIESLGHEGVGNVRIGKYIEVEFNSQDKSAVEMQTKELCDKLLTNPVIESYTFDVEGE
jgi:phosphoribosylformylglycinamidine synthase subunit PurS